MWTQLAQWVGRDRERFEDSGSLKINVLQCEASNVSVCVAYLPFQEDKAWLLYLAF